MSDNSARLSALVADEILSIWKDYEPVENYAAGFEDCKGKLFIPTSSAKSDLLRRIENARSRLSLIQDDELKHAANKLLSSISVAVAIDSPAAQIVSCSLALWYALLKEEQNESFVGEILEQAIELVEFEHSRWQGQEFSAETRKACVDVCSFLEAILITLASENRTLTSATTGLSASVADFRSLFSFPVRQPNTFEELFAFFEANAAGASENRLYSQILDHVFDYGASAQDIHTQSQQMLVEELTLAREVASRLALPVGVGANASLGETYEALSKRYAINGAVVAEAQKIMAALNNYIDGYIQDLGLQPNILPEATPPFLKPLVTSGATIALNYIQEKPLVRIYVTEEKNTSWLTLLNVLVHEAAHAYHPSILSASPTLPLLMKLKSWLAIPLMEAVAFHREMELFEAAKEESGLSGGLSRIQQELLELFDTPKFPLRDDIVAFEFETRVWRIIRALRSLCDVEVNTGKRTYVDFIKWAGVYTGFSREFIHDECFTFLASPGYTPSYSFCGSQYERLQVQARQRGVSTLDFNTEANRMGLLPWTMCVKRMEKFLPLNKG